MFYHPPAYISPYALANQVKELEIADLRRDFARQVQGFIRDAGVPLQTSLKIAPRARNARPVYIVTGAGFTPYDEATHGVCETHAFASRNGEDGTRYLMNNTAAIFERLALSGERAVVHSKDPDLVRAMAGRYGCGEQIAVITGDLGGPEVLRDIYAALEKFAEKEPVSTVRMALYQSFAQNNGEPFKPLHREKIEEVERAANRRIRFVYNMAAMGYDLLMNRGLADLRIVSLSALAATRATYGLLADSADKFMNELVWKTFHLEANISTGKPVSVYQVNPGITTACDVYQKKEARQLVKHESLADGFPMDAEVFLGRRDLPQMSAHDVAWVADALLRTPENANPNDAMPARVRALLYGGFEPDELERRFEGAIRRNGAALEIDPERRLPEHILTPQTSYGTLPQKIRAGDYRRISLSPPGQRF